MQRHLIGLAAAAAVLGMSGAAFAQAFTYQGELLNAGSPVTTPQDFEFRLFLTDAGPTQIGLTSTASDTPVVDGRFTATIDPGPGVLTGQNLWLEIAVRPGDESGAFTVLSPRQKVTPTPYAARALSEWWLPSGASSLSNDPMRPRVFINRTGPLTGAEYFGITAPSPDFTYGGMYINTTGLNALPFYGYTTGDGARSCWTFFQGSTQTWGVYNGGDRLVVESTGNVGIGMVPAAKLDVAGSVRASSFAYSSPMTRTISIPGAAFRPTVSGNLLTTESAASGTYFDASVGAAGLVAPVQLPQGAVLQSASLWVYDNGVGAFTLKVQRRPHGQFGSINAATSGSSGNSGVIQTLSVNPGLTIDNATNSYYLLVEHGDWQGATSGVFSATVTYTETAP
ncbi:MAG: hypothetical protein DYG92_13645 [Leptolyngbya sp. PLA1]|nr:hypothetical protein [Leptolyngbya sp. PLA1]